MSKALASFALVAALAALLMALSLAVARHGYPYGVIGVKRLDGIADAGTFLPLAAVYFFSALLMMILPIPSRRHCPDKCRGRDLLDDGRVVRDHRRSASSPDGLSVKATFCGHCGTGGSCLSPPSSAATSP